MYSEKVTNKYDFLHNKENIICLRELHSVSEIIEFFSPYFLVSSQYRCYFHIYGISLMEYTNNRSI